MDETLIHCVDDIETDDPDVILEIDFPDEETVYVLSFGKLFIGRNKYSSVYNRVFRRSKSKFLSDSIHSFPLNLC